MGKRAIHATPREHPYALAAVLASTLFGTLPVQNLEIGWDWIPQPVPGCAFLTMLVFTRPQGRTGSVENAEGTSGVKALQCSTERLPQLSSQRISLPTLARPGVST